MPIAITIIAPTPEGGWMWVRPCSYGQNTMTTSGAYYTRITWGNNSISWLSYNSATEQFNNKTTYYYLVLN